MRAAGIAIHLLSRRCAPAVVQVLAVLAVSAGGWGCNRGEPASASDDRLDGPPEKMELAWEEGAIPGAPLPTPVMIKEGAAPLLYLSEMAATLRVVDRTRNDLVLAESPVGARTIVLVDTNRGVVFGGQTLVAGPLPARRRYAIFVVPTGISASRSGVSQPVKRPDASDGVEEMTTGAEGQAPAEAE